MNAVIIYITTLLLNFNSSVKKIQIKYHDIKQREHQGIVDYEELSEIEGDKEILNSTYFTGNPALDVVLSEKLACS